MLFCSLKKGLTLKICLLYFVIINSILFNLLCAWVRFTINILFNLLCAWVRLTINIFLSLTNVHSTWPLWGVQVKQQEMISESSLNRNDSELPEKNGGRNGGISMHVDWLITVCHSKLRDKMKGPDACLTKPPLGSKHRNQMHCLPQDMTQVCISWSQKVSLLLRRFSTQGKICYHKHFINFLPFHQQNR